MDYGPSTKKDIKKMKVLHRGIDARKAYRHNIMIDRLFKQARKKAWGMMKQDPRVQQMIKEENERKALINRRKQETSALLQMNR